MGVSPCYLSTLPAMEAPADWLPQHIHHSPFRKPCLCGGKASGWRHCSKWKQRGRQVNEHLKRWREDQDGFGEAGEKQESCGLGGPLCLQRVCCPELERDWGPGFWFVHLFKPRSDRIWTGRVGDGCERTDMGLLLFLWMKEGCNIIDDHFKCSLQGCSSEDWRWRSGRNVLELHVCGFGVLGGWWYHWHTNQREKDDFRLGWSL